MVKVTTLATIKNEHTHVSLCRAETGQLMVSSFDTQLNMGTVLFVPRGEVLQWARAMIKAVGN